MGKIIRAYCGNCKFEQKFFLGGGMRDFSTQCSVPAINKNTGQFVIENYFKKDTLTEPLQFYNEPGMFKGEIENIELMWGEIFLKQTLNFCPECKQYTMDFTIYGYFD